MPQLHKHFNVSGKPATELKKEEFMRSNCELLLLFLTITVTLHAQDVQLSLSNIGDPAPPLRVTQWIKGTPVDQFEKGRVYVIEFWATWCKPCVAAMPHLSVLTREYKEKVTVIGIDIYETKVKCESALFLAS